MAFNISEYMFYSSIPKGNFFLGNVFEILSTRIFPKITLWQPTLYQSSFIKFPLVFVSLILVPLFITYITTWISFTVHQSHKSALVTPATVPYAVPFLGSALWFSLGNPSRYLNELTAKMKPQTAYGLKVLGHHVYILNGTENIARIWKYKTSITTPAFHSFILTRIFGMSAQSALMYDKDNSGISAKPLPYSNVMHHNRLDFELHQIVYKVFNGKYLTNLYKRWSSSLLVRLAHLPIGDDWTQSIDMMKFWLPPLTGALTEAVAGPTLETLNPNFINDFIEFLPYFQSLVKGTPKWWLPRPYALRVSLLSDVKLWEDIARAQFKNSDIDEDGDADPWWGSACMRERHEFFLGVDNWDHDAIAAAELGLLWGVNVNVHTTAIWMIIEVFKDGNLLSEVRAELASIGFRGIEPNSDLERMYSCPLLESIYSEVLRLRIETQGTFYSDQENIQINQWQFPRNSHILIPTGPAHMDKNFWNTRQGVYPLDVFWPKRFLIYPKDPLSGPERNARASPKVLYGRIDGQDLGKPKLATGGLANAFIPYGVGDRTCPGRFFAKREIMAFCAHAVTFFDIELMGSEKQFKSSSIFFGLGAQSPKRHIPFRIRKREIGKTEAAF